MFSIFLAHPASLSENHSSEHGYVRHMLRMHQRQRSCSIHTRWLKSGREPAKFLDWTGYQVTDAVDILAAQVGEWSQARFFPGIGASATWGVRFGFAVKFRLVNESVPLFCIVPDIACFLSFRLLGRDQIFLLSKDLWVQFFDTGSPVAPTLGQRSMHGEPSGRNHLHKDLGPRKIV